jgi:hypothetical protein
MIMRSLKILLLAALLASLPGVHHSSSSSGLVAGQGLDVSADNLGAGAEATANEFEQFESALELATTGGRGRCAVKQPAWYAVWGRAVIDVNMWLAPYTC